MGERACNNIETQLELFFLLLNIILYIRKSGGQLTEFIIAISIRIASAAHVMKSPITHEYINASLVMDKPHNQNFFQHSLTSIGDGAKTQHVFQRSLTNFAPT